MNTDAIKDELLSPSGLSDDLLSNGLVGVELTIEEFNLAEYYAPLYPKLSTYDRIALAIAKEKGITLLTGDKALRTAAKIEGVKIIGTLGILDQLLEGEFVSKPEYKYCLKELQKHNGIKIWLPKGEITSRLQK
jgi:predicted nucleic acid-binding protein